MIAGLKYGYTANNNDEIKAEHYKLIQDLAAEFKEKNGSIICRELLGEDKEGYIPEKRTNEYYKNRPCEKFIICAAEMIEKKQKKRTNKKSGFKSRFLKIIYDWGFCKNSGISSFVKSISPPAFG